MSELHDNVQRWRVMCAYDGHDFCGWQSQPDGSGVQDRLEQRLAEMTKNPVRIHGSGRTDAGVHALGQVFHFDLDWPHAAEKLHKALQATLPDSLLIRSVRKAAASFHARHSTCGKRYTYTCHVGHALPQVVRYLWALPDKPLAVEAMRAAAAHLLGEHDFTSFGAWPRDAAEQGNPVKTIWRLDLTERGRHLTFTVEGSGFLYKMVRSMVGTLVAVGQGRMAASAIPELLQQQQRVPAIVTAPPQGLCLDHVFYRQPKSP
jgi:tRNA pseudouridine38-40 synthase